MRVVALLALIFGFMTQMLLDGQTFSHAVFGIVCGVAAVACGLRSARTDRPNRWEGRIMAGLGLALGIWCIVMLPSAYRFQEKFNGRREHRQKMEEKNKPANKPDAANPATTLQLHAQGQWRWVADLELGCSTRIL